MTRRLLAASVAGTAVGALLLVLVLPRRCALVVPGGLPWWVAVLPLLLPLAPLAVARRPAALVLGAGGVGLLVLSFDPFGTYDCYVAG